MLEELSPKKEIVVTGKYLNAPKGVFSKKIITVQHTDVIDIHVLRMQSQLLLGITHTEGKLSILETMLPSKELFEELIVVLENRTAKQRTYKG